MLPSGGGFASLPSGGGLPMGRFALPDAPAGYAIPGIERYTPRPRNFEYFSSNLLLGNAPMDSVSTMTTTTTAPSFTSSAPAAVRGVMDAAQRFLSAPLPSLAPFVKPVVQPIESVAASVAQLPVVAPVIQTAASTLQAATVAAQLPQPMQAESLLQPTSSASTEVWRPSIWRAPMVGPSKPALPQQPPKPVSTQPLAMPESPKAQTQPKAEQPKPEDSKRKPDPVKAETAPVQPKTEPVKPKSEPLKPKVEAVVKVDMDTRPDAPSPLALQQQQVKAEQVRIAKQQQDLAAAQALQESDLFNALLTKRDAVKKIPEIGGSKGKPDRASVQSKTKVKREAALNVKREQNRVKSEPAVSLKAEPTVKAEQVKAELPQTPLKDVAPSLPFKAEPSVLEEGPPSLEPYAFAMDKATARFVTAEIRKTEREAQRKKLEAEEAADAKERDDYLRRLRDTTREPKKPKKIKLNKKKGKIDVAKLIS